MTQQKSQQSQEIKFGKIVISIQFLIKSFEIIGGLGFALALSIYFSTTYKNVAILFFFLTVTIFIIGLSLSWQQSGTKDNPKTFPKWTFLIVEVFLIICLIVIKNLTITPPFSVAVEVTIGQEKKEMNASLWFATNAKYESTISPVHRGVFIRLTNLQSKPSMIESLRVEVLNKENVWVKLPHIDMRFGKLYWVNKDFQQAIEINVMENGLDFLLDNKVLQPYQPVRGWIFFELPQDISFLSPMRIYVRDTEGVETMRIYNPSKKDKYEDSILGGTLKVLKGKWDISRYNKRYYGEPIK